jgi:hypothetical protein
MEIDPEDKKEATRAVEIKNRPGTSQPMFWTLDKQALPLAGMYRGRSAFLIASGPSFAAYDKTPLRQPGILTMGVNNSPRVFRPNLWVCVDQPDHWIRSIWLDPNIMKFAPVAKHKEFVFNSDDWLFMDTRVAECPNVVYYKRSYGFQADRFLTEPDFNWGNMGKDGGCRTVMLPAFRILYILGVRNVYLCGVDFNMSPTQKYAFEQDRNKGSIKGNNKTYAEMNKRCRQLRPLFEAQGFYIYNTNPASGLTAFDHVPYHEAIDEALSHFDHPDLANERTAGLYDTKTEQKLKGIGK